MMLKVNFCCKPFTLTLSENGRGNDEDNLSWKMIVLFCKIVNGETDTRFLYETDTLVAFRDINPHAPVHILVVPRKHIRSINDLTEDDNRILAELITAGKIMADKENIAKSGYKLLFNVEQGGGQVIFHLHLHLIGGWKDGWQPKKR
jgi:histidine triad (HIT) family protein